MQPVDILGHNRGKFSLFFPFGEFFVRRIRLRIELQYFIPIKPEKRFRHSAKKSRGKDFLRRIIVFLIVQSIYASKIRNARFRTHTRAAKKYDAPALANPRFQRFIHMQTHLHLLLYHVFPWLSTMKIFPLFSSNIAVVFFLQMW